jgi:hypothetical protein
MSAMWQLDDHKHNLPHMPDRGHPFQNMIIAATIVQLYMKPLTIQNPSNVLVVE